MKKFFKNKSGFKNISSILLLVVFTIGITPKRTLHNWFANHKDSTSTIPDGKTQQLTKAGFTCSCDDLVAESHFITAGSFVLVNVPSFCKYISIYHPVLNSFFHFHSNLRGPPFKILAA